MMYVQNKIESTVWDVGSLEPFVNDKLYLGRS